MSKELFGSSEEKIKNDDEIIMEKYKEEWDKLRNDSEVIEFYKKLIINGILKTLREPTENELLKLNSDLKEKIQKIKELEKIFDVRFVPDSEDFIIRSGY